MRDYHFQTMIILLCNLCQGISASIILTYVDSLVMYFGEADSRNSTGYYAGALLTSLMAGRTISATFWGWASDKFGRKPCVVANLLAISVLSAGFAFTTNYWIALVFRFCLGLCTCISICMRASATELTPPHFHAQANVLFTTGFNLGSVIGAPIGGLLVNNSFGFELLEEHPYALPSLLCSSYAIAMLAIVLLFFKESLDTSYVKLVPETTYAAYKGLLQNSAVMSYVVLMFTSVFVNVFASTIIPTWCWADSDHGGLTFSTADLGKLFLAINISAIVLQNVFYKPLLNRIGLVGTVKLSAWVFLPNILMMPFMASLGIMRVPLLVVGLLLNRISAFQINTAVFVMSGEEVDMGNRGKLNAIVQLSNTLGSFLAPLLAGPLFAWSLSVNIFPIDYHLVFIVDSLLSICLIRLAYLAGKYYMRLTEESECVETSIN